MVNNKSNAVYTTLAYFDIFDYPLTLGEIQKYCSKKLSKTQIQSLLRSTLIEKKENYYFLKGRKDTVVERKKREKVSIKKLARVKKIIGLLNKIPTIYYIGISGSLAMKNAQENDDIDLFIITQRGALWITRLLVTLILLQKGILRRYRQNNTTDTFCTNMWIDTYHMQFPENRHNIYTAHEIVQLYTLFDKEKTYQKFLAANKWIKKFLPAISIETVTLKTKNSLSLQVPMEWFAKTLQLWYMKRHHTTETIHDGFVAFHPNDYTKNVLRELKKRSL